MYVSHTLTQMPARVTITVPDDLHRAIQALRGTLLHEHAVDLPYSSVIEILVRHAVISLYRETNELTISDRAALEGMRDAPLAYAWVGTRGIGDAELPEDMIVNEMMPHLLKAARSEFKDDEVYLHLKRKEIVEQPSPKVAHKEKKDV